MAMIDQLAQRVNNTVKQSQNNRSVLTKVADFFTDDDLDKTKYLGEVSKAREDIWNSQIMPKLKAAKANDATVSQAYRTWSKQVDDWSTSNGFKLRQGQSINQQRQQNMVQKLADADKSSSTSDKVAAKAKVAKVVTGTGLKSVQVGGLRAVGSIAQYVADAGETDRNSKRQKVANYVKRAGDEAKASNIAYQDIEQNGSEVSKIGLMAGEQVAPLVLTGGVAGATTKGALALGAGVKGAAAAGIGASTAVSYTQNYGDVRQGVEDEFRNATANQLATSKDPNTRTTFNSYYTKYLKKGLSQPDAAEQARLDTISDVAESYAEDYGKLVTALEPISAGVGKFGVKLAGGVVPTLVGKLATRAEQRAIGQAVRGQTSKVANATAMTKSATSAIGRSAAEEGLQEGLTDWASQKAAVDSGIKASNDWGQTKEAAVYGAILGGLFGGAGNIATGQTGYQQAKSQLSQIQQTQAATNAQLNTLQQQHSQLSQVANPTPEQKQQIQAIESNIRELETVKSDNETNAQRLNIPEPVLNKHVETPYNSTLNPEQAQTNNADNPATPDTSATAQTASPTDTTTNTSASPVNTGANPENPSANGGFDVNQYLDLDANSLEQAWVNHQKEMADNATITDGTDQMSVQDAIEHANNTIAEENTTPQVQGGISGVVARNQQRESQTILDNEMADWHAKKQQLQAERDAKLAQEMNTPDEPAIKLMDVNDGEHFDTTVIGLNGEPFRLANAWDSVIPAKAKQQAITTVFGGRLPQKLASASWGELHPQVQKKLHTWFAQELNNRRSEREQLAMPQLGMRTVNPQPMNELPSGNDPINLGFGNNQALTIPDMPVKQQSSNILANSAPSGDLFSQNSQDSQASIAAPKDVSLGADGKPKWFSTAQKANEFIAKKKIGDTHHVMQTDNKRFEILPKDEQAQTDINTTTDQQMGNQDNTTGKVSDVDKLIGIATKLGRYNQKNTDIILKSDGKPFPTLDTLERAIKNRKLDIADYDVVSEGKQFIGVKKGSEASRLVKSEEDIPTPDYDTKVAANEKQSSDLRLQTTDVIGNVKGKPFKVRASAEKFQTENNLETTHEIKQVDGGFELHRLPIAKQNNIKDKANGIQDYTEIQSQVAKDMGIGVNADGEYDVNDEQFAEMNKRIDAIQREQRGLPPTKDKPANTKKAVLDEMQKSGHLEIVGLDNKPKAETPTSSNDLPIKNVGDTITAKNGATYKIENINYTDMGGISSVGLTLLTFKDGSINPNKNPSIGTFTMGEFNRMFGGDFDLTPMPTAQGKTGTEKFADNKVFTADKVAAARARMKSKLSQINSGIDPEMVMDGITITGAYVESGIRKFGDYANAMIEDFGDSIKPYLLSFWESTRHYPSGVDVSGMTSVEDSKKEFDALIKPQDLQTDAIGDKTPQSPTKQPTKKAKQSKGEMTLTDYWGVEYIDGWSETDKYKGEYSDYGVIGGVKDAFLKEAKNYLTTVADVLSQHGYDVYKDRKGKPDKAVDVNKSGTAGSGEVGLTMQNPVTDQRIYVKIGATSMRGIIPTTSNGVSVMYRTYVGGDRFGGGSNQWAQTDLTADELAQLLIEKANRELERQQPKGQSDDNSLRGTPGRGRTTSATVSSENGEETLAGVSPDDVSAVPKTGDTSSQAGRSSTDSMGRDGTPRGDGLQGLRSAGDRPATVHLTDTRSERVTPKPEQAVTADNTATDYPIAPPQSQDNSQDFTITESDEVGKGGLKTKFKQNLEAIKLLKQLQAENRQATKDEQKVLTKWVGWGGLKAAFRRGDGSTVNGWAKEVEQLEAVLTPDELDAALNSTIAAHYTEPKIVKAMWKAVEKLGFNGGRVLEPSIGSGIFLGMLPASLRKSTAFYGTELDTITGGLAQQLYPTAAIKVMGFQDYSLQDGFFKVAIGNPPFANIKITDLERKHLSGLSLHNYFFAKSLDALEDNGVLAMVVTSRLLDGADPKTRNYLFANAELLMAVRLPNNAFKENANTDVTTDIIFLRKRTKNEREKGSDVGIMDDFDYRSVGTFTDKNGTAVPLNNYFIKNPDHMLGEFGNFGTMYARGENGIETALVAPKGQNTLELLNKVLDKLPTGVITKHNKSDTLIVESMVKNIPEVKVGSMFEQDGNIYERTPDSMGDRQAVAVELPSQKAVDRVTGLIGLRSILSDVRQMQLSSNTDETVLEQRRAELNKAYDQFVKEHGHINSDANKRLFKEDPSWSQLSALEDNYDKGVSAAVSKNTGEPVKKPSAKKAAILERRTQYPFAEVTQVSSAKDGMIETLNSVGRLDLARISQLYGKNQYEVVKELGDLIYQDPVQGWVTADNYLSGNVKAKLAQAREAMATQGGELFERNVKALEQVQPQDIEAVDIEVRPGAHWIPANHITDFLKDVLGATGLQGVPTYSKFDNDWTLPKFIESAEAGTQFGTNRKSVRDIVTAAMNGKQVTVYDQIDRDTKVVNQEATNDANQKVEAVKRAWNDWIWMDDNRRDELAGLYNDIFNTDVAQAYDGSHLKLLGKVDDNVIELRPTQKNAIWRITQNPTTLLDHVVGAGKTFTMVAAAMELRRMGLASKPMIVVPNHLVGQWGKEFIQLYPNANILVATKKDFEATNRKRLVARIANGDWDAVIVAHSSFGKIAVSPEFEAEFIKQQIQEISDAIEQAKQEAGKASNARDLANRKLKLEEKYKKLTASESRDTDNLYWDELGVDALMLDEAHEFKNLAYTTSSMNRVAGLGNQSGSQKAMDLFMKIQQLKQNPSSRIVFATGTPISNSMAEMYTMQRYLDMDRMKNQGIAGFDAWAKTFGEVINDWELSASGKYQMKSRFAKFVNMPELMQSYLGFADVINRDDINDALKAQGKKLPVPKIKGGAPQNTVVERSDAQADFIGVPRIENGREIYGEHTLIYRAEHLPKGQDAKKKGADNMLKIIGEARKAALDMRILDPNAQDFAGSKVNVAVSNIMRIWRDTAADKGTQLVFCDLSTPKGSNNKEQAKLNELVRLADEGNEDAIAQLEKYTPDELDAIMNVNNFSVYDDMKQKLIAQGIPENEIAFIHDANTELQKDELFSKVRSGRIRVLLGSTSKMGAGTNVQTRLVALHHMDAPWRPSDLEQREGRIIRQGNELYAKDPENFEVEIHRYATEQTMDAMQWQIIENKAKFIEQVRKGDIKTRVIEDIEGEAANAGAMKAAASGNPLILEEMALKKQLNDLDSDKTRHDREQHRIKATIKRTKDSIESLENEQSRFTTLSQAKTPSDLDITINGKNYKQGQEGARTDAGKAIISQAIKASMSKNKLTVGQYGDFTIYAAANPTNRDSAILSLDYRGESIAMEVKHSDPAGGIITKLINRIKEIPDKLQQLKADLEKSIKAIPKLESQLKPWGKEAELDDIRRKHTEVMDALKPKKDGQQQPNDNPRYSKRVIRGTTNTTPTQVRDTLVKQFGEKTIKALEDAGVLHIKQLSDFVDENGNLSIADDAEGFFHDGKAVLIADNIDANQIIPVFLHEVGGHAGLQNMLSPNAYANLMQTFNAMVARGDEIALRAKARAELASENQDQATTEYLPYLLSEISNAQAKTPFIKRLLDRFVGAVRAWVYAKTGVRMNLTHADILGLAELTINERARNIERTAKLIKRANKQYSQPATNQSIENVNVPSYSRRFAPIQQSPIPNKPAAKKAADWLNLQWATKWVSWDTFSRLIRRNIATPQHVAITHADYKKFWDLVQQRINYTNYEAANAVGLVPEILDKRLIIGQNKKDIEAVSKVIFDGTMNDIVYGDTELTRKGLTDKQIDLYRRVRQAIDESVEKMAIDVLANSAKGTGLISLDEILRIKEAVVATGGNVHTFNTAMQQAVNAKIQAMQQAGVIDAVKAAKLTTMFGELAKQMDSVADRVISLQDEGYAPLMRFGSYAVAVNDSKGDLVLYELYETKREQQKALHDLKKNPDYAGMTFNQNVLNPGDYQQFTNKGLNPETVMLFANELGLSSDEANQAYLKVAIAQQSALKRLIHRKKVAGFSEDLPRVLSAFVMSNARHSSRMLYNGDIEKSIQGVKDGDLRGEAQNLFENMENPKEEFASFRSMMFHWNMGFSPAFGLLNMTQPFIQTIPQLTIYDGVIGAHKSVLNGIRKAMASQVLEDAKGLGIAKNAKDFVDTIPSYMRDDYIRMTKEGHLDPQNVWLLQGLERGKAGVASGALGMVGQAAGYISEATETINRRATMYAALEIAHKLGAAKLKAKGFDSAYDFAVTTIQQTQGVYNKGNRSGLARSTGAASKFGAVIMMYKQFSINLIEQQIRMGQQKQAKALATAWVYQWLLAGAAGLIAADDLKDIIETIAFKFGYALNTDRKMQEFFIDTFGKEQGNDFYQMFNYGVLSSVSPIDFYGRSSAGNIIPATGLLHPSKAGDQKTEATEALGVGANWIGSMFDAGKLMMNGQFRDAMVTAAPRYIRDSVQAYEIATTGSMRDKNGRKVMDMTQGDAVAKALQFNPKSNAQRGREAMSNWQDKKLIENVKGDFTVKLAEAIASKDQAAQDKVMADIDKWNAKNDKQYQMDKTKITKSATDKAKKRDFTADERQTLPKSLEEYVNSLKKTG